MTTQPDQLQKIADQLGIELSSGVLHFDILAYLEDNLEANREAIDKAALFWLHTMKAHHDAALMSLSKVFDEGRNTISLHTLLKLANQHEGRFKQMAASKVPSLLETVGVRVNALRARMKPIVRRRHEVLAHLALARDPRCKARFQVALDEIGQLYGEALGILNDVLRAYKGNDAIVYQEENIRRSNQHACRVFGCGKRGTA